MKKICYFICIMLLICVQSTPAREETLILFDSSVSMGDSIGSSRPKYQIATEATKTFLGNVPDSQYIGLRIIGILFDSNILNYMSNPDALCKATRLLVPIETNSTENIKLSLDTLIPLGTTPLIYSIKEAVKSDFSSQAEQRRIILITDGIDGCGGNLCKFIKEFKQQNLNVVIYVIEIGAEAEAIRELQCLAEETGGKVFSASNVNEITKAYKDIFTAKVPIKIDYKANKSVINPVNNQVRYKNLLLEFNK